MTDIRLSAQTADESEYVIRDLDVHDDVWLVSFVFGSPPGMYPKQAWDAYVAFKKAVPIFLSASWTLVGAEYETDAEVLGEVIEDGDTV